MACTSDHAHPHPRGLGRAFAIAAATGLALALFSNWADAAGEGANVVGAGVRTGPAWVGAATDKTDVVPVLSLAGGPWFARSTHGVLEGGARRALGGGVTVGAQAAHEAGPRDEDPAASIGAHVEWRAALGPAPMAALARYRRHLDAERGDELDARIAAGLYEGHGLRAGLFGYATWADRKHQQAYYGVADSGLLHAGGGVFAAYDVSRNVSVVAAAEARRLAGAPAASEYVRERTSTYINAGIAYRF
jgi:outer membrane scaffolding protein for murein synthesis (MipA/OmpV family)